MKIKVGRERKEGKNGCRHQTIRNLETQAAPLCRGRHDDSNNVSEGSIWWLGNPPRAA